MSAGELALEQVIELPGSGRALFSARADGNVSSVGGDGAQHAGDARERLRRRLGLEQLVRGYQEHGAVVERVRAAPRPERASEELPRADGQATALPGLGMMVLAADCLPVALGCDGAVAMVHAGWRGLAAGVLEQGVLALRELSRGEPIEAIVGPCAGVCCYEVGAEVHDAFGGAHRSGENLDLRAIAHERLASAGVGRVRHVNACTICDQRFFSHRREGARAGRQAGVAWLS
ncbi:MAG: polyphenol oxidase family protein [Solirubrobacteraceae bacterium]